MRRGERLLGRGTFSDGFGTNVVRAQPRGKNASRQATPRPARTNRTRLATDEMLAPRRYDNACRSHLRISVSRRPPPPPFTREGWLFELKYDAFRILATEYGNDVALLRRRRTDFTDTFPEILAELAELPELVLDGELVILDANGKPQFEQLVRRSRLNERSRSSTAPAALFAFDVLELRGRDLREMALMDSKKTLAETLGTLGRIRAIDYVLTSDIELFRQRTKHSLRGSSRSAPTRGIVAGVE